MTFSYIKIISQEQLIKKLIDLKTHEILLIDVILTRNLGVPLLYATITNNIKDVMFLRKIVINVGDHLSYLIEFINLSVPFIIYNADNLSVFYDYKSIAHHKESIIFKNENFLFEYFNNKV